jgi:hypothetical protein
MAKTYRVTGACVTNVPVTTAQGEQLATFYTGHVLPRDVPDERIKHLLSVGLIKEAESAAPAAEEAASTTSEAVPTVTARSTKPELIAYGVAQGGDQKELDALTRDQLLDRYVRKQQQ